MFIYNINEMFRHVGDFNWILTCLVVFQRSTTEEGLFISYEEHQAPLYTYTL